MLLKRKSPKQPRTYPKRGVHPFQGFPDDRIREVCRRLMSASALYNHSLYASERWRFRTNPKPPYYTPYYWLCALHGYYDYDYGDDSFHVYRFYLTDADYQLFPKLHRRNVLELQLHADGTIQIN